MLTDDFPFVLRGISLVLKRARLVETKGAGPLVTVARMLRAPMLRLGDKASVTPHKVPASDVQIEIRMENVIDLGRTTVERGVEIGEIIGAELDARGVDTGTLNCIIAVRREGDKLVWGHGYEVQPVATAGVPA